ncbi:hypothetical protein MICAK_2780025 [Microcystis aeruginosa PCC 9701]|uniref:Uncharacterized protein n=1 Tax=Microcystis aeruginosa PCC 9701 TaxID=721123 RepID=I4IRH6_MICAE|nr:hypothetical protein MICAK_2780025 [Microcystis aeruginosa PCC 9701]
MTESKRSTLTNLITVYLSRRLVSPDTKLCKGTQGQYTCNNRYKLRVTAIAPPDSEITTLGLKRGTEGTEAKPNTRIETTANHPRLGWVLNVRPEPSLIISSEIG